MLVPVVSGVQSWDTFRHLGPNSAASTVDRRRFAQDFGKTGSSQVRSRLLQLVNSSNLKGVITMADDQVLANQKSMMANQEKMMANQDKILANQEKMMANQDKILANQEKMLAK
jgi:hypothetical protein